MADSLLCGVLLLVFAVSLHRKSAGPRLTITPRSADYFTDFAACAVSGWLYALLLCLSARPYFALTLSVLLLLGLYCVNLAKIKALRGEPLVFADVALAWQAVRFPELYLPFLPCKILTLGALAGGLCLGSLWLLTEPVSRSVWWTLPLCWVLVFPFVHSRYGLPLAQWLQNRWPLTFKPQDDARFYGPLGAAILHLCWHLGLRGKNGMDIIRYSATSPAMLPWSNQGVQIMSGASSCEQDSKKHPNIFLVQAESFCDPRVFSPLIPSNILPHYDAVCAQGISGSMAVGAFGAYTMRTEFAVLTGQPASSLGTDAFHPYWSASNTPAWSIARHLRDRGYRTVCLHPFHREFFFRHKAIPNLGFEEFISLEDFPYKETFGPYVSDASVTRAMLDLLHDDRPVFCFAITMESHGPWREGRLPIGDFPIAGLSAPVTRYLTHLRNADAMIGQLCAVLNSSRRPGVLGWYGDHLPNLPDLIPEGETEVPFFVWKNFGQRMAYCKRMLPEFFVENLLS